MQGIRASFVDSYREFGKARTITTASMFGAVSIVLGSLTLQAGDFLKVGFSTIANQMVYLLFGPAVGGCFGAALDVLKYFIKPTGEFFPGWTLGAAAAGVLYGLFFYKKRLTFLRVLAAEFTVSVVCNMLLGTLWLDIMYGKGFFVLLRARVLKNLLMCPANALIFYSLVRAMEQAGVFRALRKSV